MLFSSPVMMKRQQSRCVSDGRALLAPFTVADWQLSCCVMNSMSQHALLSRLTSGAVRGAEAPLVLKPNTSSSVQHTNVCV